MRRKPPVVWYNVTILVGLRCVVLFLLLCPLPVFSDGGGWVKVTVRVFVALAMPPPEWLAGLWGMDFGLQIPYFVLVFLIFGDFMLFL